MSTLLIGMSTIVYHPNENSTDSVAAWFGSIINGPIVDRLGRKLAINIAVIIFVIGSAIQCGAVDIPMLFAGAVLILAHKHARLTLMLSYRTCSCRHSNWPIDHGGASVYLRGMKFPRIESIIE